MNENSYQELENKDYFDRVTLAYGDLLKAKAYCEALLNLDAGVSFSTQRYIYEALCVALVVSYGRVFHSSKTVNEFTNENVSNRFGRLKRKIIESMNVNSVTLHHRIMEKRDKVFAHSDASSRNYKHYSNSQLAVGRNPFYPYDHEEIQQVFELVETLVEAIGAEQSRVGSYTFDKNIFGM